MYSRYMDSPTMKPNQPSQMNTQHFNNEFRDLSTRENNRDGRDYMSSKNADVTKHFDNSHLERESKQMYNRGKFDNYWKGTVSPCPQSPCQNTRLENLRLKDENRLLKNRMERLLEMEDEMKTLRERYHASLEANAELEEKIKQKEEEVWDLEFDVDEQNEDIEYLEKKMKKKEKEAFVMEKVLDEQNDNIEYLEKKMKEKEKEAFVMEKVLDEQNDNIEYLQAENCNLQIEVGNLQQDLNEEQEYINRLEALISILETEMQCLKHELCKVQRNNARMRTALQKNAEDIALRDQALDRASRERKNLQDKMNSMERSIKFGNVKKKNEEIKKMDSTLLLMMQNSKQVKEKIRQIESEKKDLQKRIGQLQNQLHSREAEFNLLQEENRRMQMIYRSPHIPDVKKLDEELEKVRQEKLQLKDKVKELKAKLSRISQRNNCEDNPEMLLRELEKLKEENKKLVEGNRRLLQENNDIKMMHASASHQKDKEIVAAKERVEEMDIEIKSLQSKLRDLEQAQRLQETSDYKTLYEENKNLRKDKTHLEVVLQECKKSLNDEQEKVRSSQSILMALQTEKQRLEDDLFEMRKEEKKWFQRNFDKEEENRHLQENLNKMSSENMNLHAENTRSLNQRYMETEKQLSVMGSQTSKLKERINHLESENNLLQKNILDISREKESSLTRQQKTERERIKLNSEIQHKKEEVERLQECIAQKERTIVKLERELTGVLRERDSALKRINSNEQNLLKENRRLEEEINHLQTSNKLFQEENIRSASEKVSKLEEQLNIMKRETRHLQQRITEQSAENSKLKDDIAEVTKEKDNALTRLSKVAGAKLTHGNAAITDLSDTNRPTKIAEKFSELYDNQWTDAFEELDNTYNDEEETIQVLLKILKEAYDFCVRTETNYETRIGQAVFTLADENSKESRQITGADVPVQKALTDLRLSLGNACCLIVEEMFLKRLPSILKKVDVSVSPKTKLYARQCASLCWRMRIRDPPVFVRFEFRQGTEFNTDILRRYTKTGGYLDFIVWPALYLHEKGPVLSKGVAQPKHAP